MEDILLFRTSSVKTLNFTVMKKILVPCDFSQESLNAYRSAVSVASLEKAELHLLHVIELPVMQDAILMPVLNFEESLLNALKSRAEAGFKKLITESEAKNVSIQTHISFGPTGMMILNFIEENVIDLVVMGTKGASGVKEVFVGSNTEKIVRSSKVPVIVVRKPIDAASIRSIVFAAPVNFDEEEELITEVKQLQNFFKASLHLLWINTPTNFSSDHETKKRLTEFARRYLLRDYTINIFNDVYEESGIIHFSHDIKADLVAMGTHGRKGLAHVFGGSLTEDVVNHIDLPVWTYSLRSAKDKK
jgi:nucleotide-binding universal stress UspA family protein